MLRTHGRYAYSNITKRPDYSWPGGKRLAVYVAVNIEQFSHHEGKGAGIAPPEQSNTHSVFSWRDYGNRVSIWRLFELFDELDIPAEAQMNTAIYEHSPDIPQKLRKRGDEILGHGITNSEEQGHLADMLIDTFDEMLEQSARQPLLCPISLHPFVMGRPYRIRQLRWVFQHILRHRERIWLTRPRDICAYIESLPAGIVPGS